MNKQRSDRYRLISQRLWLALYLFSLSLFCHSAPLIHLQQSQISFSINTHIDIFEDPIGNLQFSEVATPPLVHQFAPVNEGDLQFNFSRSAYWLRFSIQNHLDKEQKLWLIVDPPNLLEVALFQKNSLTENNNQPSKITGREIPFHDREIKQQPLLLTFSAPTKETTNIYLRVKSDTPINLDLQISSPEIFISKAIDRANLSNIGLGAILILFLANLVLSSVFRDRLYLSYSLYLFSLFGFQATTSGLLQWLLPSVSSSQTLITYTCICIVNCSALYFAYLFLYSQQLHRIWKKTIIVITCINISAYLSVYILPLPSFYLFIFIGLSITATIVFIAPLHCYFANNSFHALILAGARTWTVLAILAGSYAIQSSIAEFNLANVWVTLAFGIEGLIVTLTLIAYSLQNKAKCQQQQQQIAITDAESKAQSAILSRISHDVRTPMNGVIGMTELLLDTSLTPTQKDHVDTIQSSGQALLDLINEILDRSKIDAGKMEISRMPFDLTALLNECLASYRSEAEDKNIELISHIHADVPTLVVSDATRLRQILMHILSNAFKYTEQGEIVLTVTSHADQDDDSVKFTINDTGRGISQIDQKNLFNPHTEESKSLDFHFGLGLSVTKQLIGKMDGEIGVESELGKGSKFWFSLPLPAQYTSKESERAIEKTLSNKRMLVVDDNLTCRKVIQQQANTWGMNVSTAHSGNEAMAMLRAKINLDTPYDIIIVDHNMPGMTGLQLANKITNELPKEQQPLLIMLTGLSHAPAQQKAGQAGIKRVLTKPVTGKALKITLAEELNLTDPEQNNSADQDQDQIIHKPIAKGDQAINILLAEDNPVSQKVIVSMLKKLGLACHTVNNGLQAIRAVQNDKYDLILMDCEMPVMDGFQSTEKIREWERLSEQAPTPIIALTAHIMDEHKEHSLDAGMNAHLTKPVDIHLLETTLRQWIETEN